MSGPVLGGVVVEYLATAIDPLRRKELDQRYGRNEIWEVIDHYNAVRSAKADGRARAGRARALHGINLPEKSLERERIEAYWGRDYVARKVVRVTKDLRQAALSKALIKIVTKP